ncbi:methyltransferase family protein [Nisaea sediminum]|uniref:methyltransferase family protein n=1 Tax=Nisaea sediminum TaxID=2775867 RepID=UPI001865E0CB|nr:isoprenylcysteine carboxylmethyltransferase family protein [Nisaea sediminum]
MSEIRDDEGTGRPASPLHWIRLAAVYLLIPAILLLCGGELGWWQAWLYSGLVIVAGLGGRIWAEWRHPGLMAERQDVGNFRKAKSWDKVLAPLMAVSIGYPLVIAAGLDHRFHGSPEFPLWLNAAGFLLITFGYGFAVWALAENRFFFSVVVVRTDRGHVVCDTGPYRYVRHPGYAGNIYALFGIVLALDSLWTLIPVAVALVVSVIRTALEDRTLLEELPGYRDYARRVRYRLVPGVY